MGNLCIQWCDVWIYLVIQTVSKEEKVEEREDGNWTRGRDTRVRTYAHKAEASVRRSNTYPRVNV